MYRHQIKKRVRYGETDQMGYLYYGNYATYYEIGRTEFIRSLGTTYRELEVNHGVMMPVVRMTTKFYLPARYDDEITIVTELAEVPTKFMTFISKVYNEAGDLLNEGEVKLLFVDMKTNKRVDTPDYLLDILMSYFS